MRECVPKANGDLARRPIAAQVIGHPSSQSAPPREQTRLRPARVAPGTRIGIGSSVQAAAAIAANLPANRRSGSAKAPGHLTYRQPGRQTSGNLFALLSLQSSWGATTASRCESAVAP